MSLANNLSNVNIGTAPDAGDGDLLRTAFSKINDNFNSIYSDGQHLTYAPDNRLAPGFAWYIDRDTGFFRKASGQIGVSLNGQESLVLKEDGSITWFGDSLATRSFVTTQLNTFTGGVSNANITITVNTGVANVSTNVTINGFPSVGSLPTVGNHEGRVVFFNGDVWIFTQYPIGNGAGLAANPSIARAAGSDYRWVRFRGDSAFSIGISRPSSSPEGTFFYETSNAIAYVYISGQWRSLSSVVAQSNAFTKIEISATLPSVSSPDNFTGRTVIVGSNAYVFASGAWNLLSNYTGGGSSGSGIRAGSSLPSTLTANTGDLFRLTGTNAGLYIFDNSWQTIPQYAGNASVATIPTLASLPASVATYNPGSLVIVGNLTYILNATKTSWDLFTPLGANANATFAVAITANAVSNVGLASNAVLQRHISPNVIFGYHLTANTVGYRELANLTIDSSKLAPNAVTTSKIQNATITGEKIAANTIEGSKLLTGSITSDKLAGNIFSNIAITAANISSISSDLGNVNAGRIQSADGKFVIDLNNKFIRIEL